jgi:putative IMPACT (imprinted ancient) family translation regulator
VNQVGSHIQQVILIDEFRPSSMKATSVASSQSSSSSSSSSLSNALGEIRVADSRFLGFCVPIQCSNDVNELQRSFQKEYPDASHIPVAWWIPPQQVDSAGGGGSDAGTAISSISNNGGFDEDGEPPGSVGHMIQEEIQTFFSTQGPIVVDMNEGGCGGRGGVAVIVARYFGERLLGVTCGRLGQCYRAITRLTLHRCFRPDIPLELTMDVVDEDDNEQTRDIYGMGAGDCELILNCVEEDFAWNPNDSTREATLVQTLLSELQFDGFRGASDEVLPRLQNLQADLSTGVLPIYRYPGNYFGTEWTTFSWSPTSLRLKEAVEEKLRPLVHQTMNHCVTNYYRDGKDFIAHHSDKDLDLNRDGVIVSLSLGAERTLELKRRAEPRDVIRVPLPHRSMLVLGPYTNREWTHAILPNVESTGVRLSLTLREVMTFQDLSTGRLFGQGVGNTTLQNLRTRALIENTTFCGSLFVLSSYFASRQGLSSTKSNYIFVSAVVAAAIVAATAGLGKLSVVLDRRRQEREARDFFSKTSSAGTKY